MAADPLSLEGPVQRGQGVAGQYVYWICMPHPLLETVAEHGIKTPEDFDRDSFRVAVLEDHQACGVELLESVCFLEQHASGKPHLNQLVRAKRPYRWLKVAQRLLQHRWVHVGFCENIRPWSEGVAYGRVATEHKGPESLDHKFVQWHHAGENVPFHGRPWHGTRSSGTPCHTGARTSVPVSNVNGA